MIYLYFTVVLVVVTLVIFTIDKLRSIKGWRKFIAKTDILLARLEPYLDNHAVVICDKAQAVAKKVRDWKEYAEFSVKETKRCLASTEVDDYLYPDSLRDITHEIMEIENEANGDLTARLACVKQQLESIVIPDGIYAQGKQMADAAYIHLTLVHSAVNAASEAVSKDDRANAIDALTIAEASLQEAIGLLEVIRLSIIRRDKEQDSVTRLSREYHELTVAFRDSQCAISPESRYSIVMLSLQQADLILRSLPQASDPNDESIECLLETLKANIQRARQFMAKTQNP